MHKLFVTLVLLLAFAQSSSAAAPASCTNLPNFVVGAPIKASDFTALKTCLTDVANASSGGGVSRTYGSTNSCACTFPAVAPGFVTRSCTVALSTLCPKGGLPINVSLSASYEILPSNFDSINGYYLASGFCNVAAGCPAICVPINSACAM